MGPFVRYTGGLILRDHQFIQEDLWIQEGKIVPPAEKAEVEVDISGLFVAPGYIDLQINGGFGVDFTENPDQIDTVAKILPKYGVTSFLPTVVSSSSDQYQNIAAKIQARRGNNRCANILGIHLEGPFINPKQAGAHTLEYIRPPAGISSLEDFYGDLSSVKLVTLAPEIPGALQAIAELRERNIVVSAGHSEASFEEMQKGIQAGITMVTHLFNAMPSLQKRNPGIVGEVFTHQPLYYSLIVDGIHVHPACVNIAWKCNPRGLILVTDAIAAFGKTAGRCVLGKKHVVVEQGNCFLEGTNTLAGSILSLDEAVKHLHRMTGCSMAEALESASLTPAKVLGIESYKGSLNIGCDADFILLDEHLNVKKTYIGGDLFV